MQKPSSRPAAAARIAGGGLHGCVSFYPMGEHVLVEANICGLPKSDTDIFALHIHEGASCGGEGFADTGSHYNPKDRPHPGHAGDLPPLFSCKGRAYMTVMTDRFCIGEILGKTVVIHSDPDDFRSQPAGNAGKKIACGVIKENRC